MLFSATKECDSRMQSTPLLNPLVVHAISTGSIIIVDFGVIVGEE
jgi:hypothetical protein